MSPNANGTMPFISSELIEQLILQYTVMGNYLKLKHLLTNTRQYHFNIDACNPEKYTALQLATEACRVDLCGLLCRAGADATRALPALSKDEFSLIKKESKPRRFSFFKSTDAEKKKVLKQLGEEKSDFVRYKIASQYALAHPADVFSRKFLENKSISNRPR